MYQWWSLSWIPAYAGMTIKAFEQVYLALTSDRLQLHDRTERGWMPPPKGYTDDMQG